MPLNSLFQQMIDDTYKITNRPDLVDLTKLFVKSATLRAHQADFWSRDIVETAVIFNGDPAYMQELQYSTLFPRWRAAKYMRLFDTVTQTAGQEYEIIKIEEIFDSYGITRENVAYVAGTVINIRSSTALKNMLLAYYTNPDLVDESYDSWIAKLHPDAITFNAASKVFKAIGNDQESTKYNDLSNEVLSLITINNVTDVGS